jgi:RecB family exonuclease
VTEACSPGEEVLAVVEGEAAVRYERDCGRSAVTREELFGRLFSVLLPGVALASPIDVRVVLSDTLTELGGSEPWLGALASRGGRAWLEFVAVAYESLVEARRMSWLGSPATGRSVAGDLRASVLVRASRLLDTELARRGLVDPSSREELIARALLGASLETVVATLGTRRVLATGMASWRPADLLVWRGLDAKLSHVGGAAKIALPAFERPLDAALAEGPIGRLVDAVAEALDDAPETRAIAPVLGDFTLTGELSPELAERVELRACEGAAGQARAIVDAVEEALRSVAPPTEIAVVFPEGRSGGATVARMLADAGVPVHVQGGAPDTRSGLVACAIEALLVAESAIPRLGLAALLRSSYVDPSHLTGIRDEAAARLALDRISLALETTATVVASSPEDSLVATVLAYEQAQSRRGARDGSRQSALVRRIAEPFGLVRRGATLLEHVVRAWELFRALGLRAQPGPGLRARLADDASWDSIASAELTAFARDANGAARLWATLDSFEKAAGDAADDRPYPLSSFRLELERELLAPEPVSEAGAVGAIRITTLRELSQRPLALLVFADADEGSLDTGDKQESLFDGAVRTKLLEGMDPALRASVRATSDAERVRLALAADAARRIVVTYSVRSEEGGPSPPHSFALWLSRQAVRKTEWRDKVLADPPLSSHEVELLELATGSLEARGRHPSAASRAAVEARRESAFGLPSRSHEGVAKARGVSDEVSAILVEETGGGQTPMSVTSLDRFGACLFQGFASQVLRARKHRVVPEVVDPREEGTLLHAALASAFGATRELWAARPREAARIRSLARDAAIRAISPVNASPLRRLALDAIAEAAMKIVEWSLADEAWDFSRAEARFGSEQGGWQTVSLDDARTKVRLLGTTDRVDIEQGGERLRVIDYKRGEDGARRLTSELGETSFQLAVYGKAASLALGLGSAPGMYVPTRRISAWVGGKGATEAWARAHALEEGVPRFERRALELVGRVRRGDLEPRPKSPETCRVCDLDGVCRKPRFVIVSALEDGQEDARDGD